MERLCQVVVGSPLRIHGAEIPQFVLYDRPAYISADVLLGKTIGRRTGEWEVLYVAHSAARRKVPKNIAMDLVAAALGDHVKDAACGFAVFRSIGAGLDFHFLYEFKRQVGSASTKSGIRRADAVQDVIVLRTGGAGDGGVAVAAGGIAQARAGGRGRDRVEALYVACRREIGEPVGTYVGTGRGGGNVDGDGIGIDYNLGRRRTHFQ